METKGYNPLYLQLKSVIEEKITNGEFHPDERIPSETELCQIYGVSRITVRRAISELVNVGKLVKIQGQGTYIAKSPINSGQYRLQGFTAEMEKQGLKPSAKVLEFTIILPTVEIANLLAIDVSEAVYKLVRLRSADEIVISYSITHLPFKYFPDLINENLENKSLYSTLISKYNVIPTRAGISLEAMPCPNEYLDKMQLEPNTSVLHLNALAFDQFNRKIECTDAYYRGDMYTFHTEINKYQSPENPNELLQRVKK